MQTKFGEPEGNCLQACLASLFESNIDRFPDFGTGSEWWDNFVKWTFKYERLYPVSIAYKGFGGIEGYYIVSGLAQRGLRHSVVARGVPIRLAHDPHPDQSFLTTHEDVILFVEPLTFEDDDGY